MIELNTNRLLRWSLFAFAGIAVVLVLAGGWVIWTVNEGCDNPGIVLDVESDGTVILQTYRGVFRGPLADVRWHDNPRFVALAHEYIHSARRDTVKWGSSADGIRIWYQSDDGETSLNEQLAELSDAFKMAGDRVTGKE